MKVDSELIQHLASLARLELTEAEVHKFTPQLKEVLEIFGKLSEVNTEGLLPSFQPVIVRNVLREDAPHESLSQEEALSLTTHKKDGYFKGPKVV